jgi:hypothetical protein
MLLFGKECTIFLNRSNEASCPVNGRSSFMGESAMCFLSENRDLCEAVSLSGAGRVERRGFPDNDPSGFEQLRADEMSGTDATDLLICSQNQTQPIEQARRIALGDRRQQTGKKSLYVAGAASME